MYEAHLNAILAAWNEGNYDGLDPYVADDAVRKSPASVSSDAGSLAELKQVIADFRTAFPDGKVTIDEMEFVGDRSYGRWTFTGTNTGPGDFPPTGRSVTVRGVSHGRYQDGKMTEELVYFDGMDMMSQLGLIDLPGADG